MYYGLKQCFAYDHESNTYANIVNKTKEQSHVIFIRSTIIIRGNLLNFVTSKVFHRHLISLAVHCTVFHRHLISLAVHCTVFHRHLISLAVHCTVFHRHLISLAVHCTVFHRHLISLAVHCTVFHRHLISLAVHCTVFHRHLISLEGHCVRSWCDGSSDRSFIVDPLSYFLFQPVLHDWCNKGRGMCYHFCGMMHIKDLRMRNLWVFFFLNLYCEYPDF